MHCRSLIIIEGLQGVRTHDNGLSEVVRPLPSLRRVMSAPASGRYAHTVCEAEISGQMASLQRAPPTNEEKQAATRALARMSREHSDISVNEGMLQLYVALKRAGPGGARVLPQAMKTWKTKFYTEARFMQKYWVVEKSKGPLPEAALSRLVDPSNVVLPSGLDGDAFWIIDSTFPKTELPLGTAEVQLSAVLQKKHGPRDSEGTGGPEISLLPEPVAMRPAATPSLPPPPQSPPKIPLRPLKRWGSDPEREGEKATTTVLEKIAFNTSTVPAKKPIAPSRCPPSSNCSPFKGEQFEEVG